MIFNIFLRHSWKIASSFGYMKKIKWLTAFFAISAIAILAVIQFNLFKKANNNSINHLIDQSNVEEKNNESDKDNEEKQLDDELKGAKKTSLPEKTLIKVPFVLQSPFGNWDELHEEMCEEASLMMLYQYHIGQSIDRHQMDQKLKEMARWEQKMTGDYTDSNVSEMISLARGFYGLDFSQHLKVVSLRDPFEIKSILSDGHPILLPAAGRLLGNSNFTAPGPIYHNLILLGYEKNDIITNDPGTRKGEGYRYSLDVLWKALHDFPGKGKDMSAGDKSIIVYYK